jgi:type I restriction enzyme S subunit
MEVRPGYKQTEVGEICSEWEVKQLGELGTVVRGGSPRPAGDPRFFNGNFVPWLTVGSLTNIPTHRIFVTDTATKLTVEGAKHSRTLKLGTLVIVNSGAKTLGVSKILGITCCANDGIAALVNQQSGEKRFLCYFLNSQIQRLREVVAAGNDQLNLNTGRIALISVPFPPDGEQRAIADTLSDVDALLDALDRLITKKRDLQQASMQQLLTGQTRLPGFNAAWEVKTVSELANVTKGTQLRHSETTNEGQFPHLNGGIYPSNYTDKENTPANTIAISEGGNSCGYVQFVRQRFWCGGHCYAVVPKNTNNRFLYYALKGQQTAVMGLRVGSGLPNVQKSALEAFNLKLPSDPSEQTAIAAALTDMDIELVALEQQHAKTRDIKQAMIQQLLTGKTRVVAKRASHA